ncbi:hypothetical protein [Pedobacter helvus]|uniref:Uncharacterized protein n=1 Tax=Pedobacter helvus TaxID=2563444 RepID=A0ABW9JQ99_9SPHI|nr:hypothetical protein [Pedobacter ureilyticus]
MKAISNREHKLLLTALRQLEELQKSGEATFPADGFVQHIQSLNESFTHYEFLIMQLADCILAYQTIYKEIRTNVVVPRLRQVKKKPMSFNKT